MTSRSTATAICFAAITAVCWLMWSNDTASAKGRHEIVKGLVPGLPLETAFEIRSDLVRLDPPWDFGPMQGIGLLKGTAFAGAVATVFLQSRPGEMTIRQVLIDIRDDGAVTRDKGRVFAELIERFGKPEKICRMPMPPGSGREAAVAAAIWRAGGITTHYRRLDHRIPGLLYFAPDLEPSVLDRELDRRRISRRSLPRRLLVRQHLSTDLDLVQPLSCPKSDR